MASLLTLLKLHSEVGVFFRQLFHALDQLLFFEPHLADFLQQRFFTKKHDVHVVAISLLVILLVDRFAIVRNDQRDWSC